MARHRKVAARRALVGNRLVVVQPAGLPMEPQPDLHTLLGPSVRRVALADPEAVPAGIYAREALVRAGLWERLQPRLVPTLDVRAALALVELGEADAGLVYASDAAASRRVRVAGAVDPSLHGPIVYPLLLLDGAGVASRRLFEYLLSEEGTVHFLRRGFLPPPE